MRSVFGRWPGAGHFGPRASEQPQQQPPEDRSIERTGSVLKRLPERDWTVLSGFDLRRGVDHILVGPGGVFVIASRKPQGPGVKVKDGVLWLRKGQDARAYKPEVAINRDALHGARVLDREIRLRTGRPVKMHPIVVLWCEFPQRTVESSQILFIHGQDLLSWLSERPLELQEGARLEIIEAIRAIPNDGGWRAPHVRRHRAA